jgi:putative ABC transport system permease protein
MAALALAVGIGSVTSICTVVNAVMLKPLPYRDGDRFVTVFSGDLNDPEHYGSVTVQDAQAYQERNRVFDAIGWFRDSGKNLMYAGAPLHVDGVMLTRPLALELGVNPVLGHWFDDEHGVMISNSLWRQLGSDPGIIGKPIALDGQDYVISGVMPPAFHFPVAGIASAGNSDVWMPLNPNENSGNAYFIYARRKPAVSFTAATDDVLRIARELATEQPASHPAYTAKVFDLRETVVRDVRPTLLLLMGAAGLLFLIACANASGLLLARAVVRTRETAVRVALGAGRGQLAAGYFAEGLVVSLAGAVGGVLLSHTMTPAIVLLAANYLPHSEEIEIDWTVLLFAAGAALFASGLASLAPLWQAMRTMPADALSEGVKASASARSRRISELLAVAEIGLAFALLTVSAALILHLRELARIAPGFDSERLLSFVISIPGRIAQDGKLYVPLENRLVDQLRAIPGVERAALASQLPLKGCCMGTRVYPEGRPADPAIPQRTSLMAVTPAYFETMKIPLRAGRYLAESDRVQDLIWVVVDQAAAKRYWGEQNPVGSYGRFNTPGGDRFQVIGVVGDVKNDGLSAPTVPNFYILAAVYPVESINVVVRSTRDPASLMEDVRRVIHGIDAEQPITEVATMGEVIGDTMSLERAGSYLTSFFAASALLLAMLGAYSVVAYAVRQRTVEIGTRMAIGATTTDVLGLVISGGARLAVYGIALGGAGSIGAIYYLSKTVNLGAIGALPFVYAVAIISVVAMAASILPAWRASLVSPLVAIRNEPESAWQAAHSGVRRMLRDLGTPDADAPVSIEAVVGGFADAIRSAVSFPEAMKSALNVLQERTGARWITLLENGRDVLRGGLELPARGYVWSRTRGYPHPLEFSEGDLNACLQWAREFEPRYIAEIETLRKAGVRLAVPLRIKNEIVGMLLAGAATGSPAYNASRKQAFATAADVFALLIENARLTDRALKQQKLEQDIALAAEVQKKLLPPEAPQSSAVELAAFTVAARTVGGDYYDFLHLESGHIGIAIADVSGKGVSAALLMSVVQASLRAIASEGQVALGDLASRINRFLYRSTGANKYATFFYAEVAGNGRSLRFVNAGHNPPYLVSRDGVVELTASGPPLGLFAEMRYEESALALNPGDVLVAFTDGVPEALNERDEEFGEERLKDLLRSAIVESASAISEKIARSMRDWAGTAEQFDDLTVVVLRVQ